MSDDPLKGAVDEIEPKLSSDLHPLIDAIRTEESIEEAWEFLVQEVLGEA